MPVSDRAECSYQQTRRLPELPRLPLAGSLDLTYRCNNNCRHCWLRLPARAREGRQELALEEVIRIAEEARAMGCREWHISGGEPMLRPDFSEIFECLTHQSRAYTLNTNGTLITPEIARLLKRPGSKLVVIYGATAPVHDHITRTPGSFEAAMQGLAYLKACNFFDRPFIPDGTNRSPAFHGRMYSGYDSRSASTIITHPGEADR